MRKGLGKGKGSGYYNIIGKDPMVHKMSRMGIKQPQRAPYYAVNPALTKYSNVKLQEGAVEERIKHPKFSMTQARQMALDNLRENPRAYGKRGGKYVVYSWKKTPKQGGIFTELNTEKEAQKLVKDMNRIHKTNEWVYANPHLFDGKGGKKLAVEWTITTKKFRNKKTGEIVTQVPILDIGDYEEVKGGKGGKLKRGSIGYEFASANTNDFEFVLSPFQSNSEADNNPDWFKKIEKQLEKKYGQSWKLTGKSDWIITTTKGGKKLLKGTILRDRTGKEFHQGDRIAKGDWSDKRWEKARKKDNKQIGKQYEEWEKSKYQRWK